MTHFAEVREIPEPPHGDDFMDRMIALLIIVVACLAAFAAYMEVKSATLEATADRHAKIEMLDATGAQINISTAASVQALTTAEGKTWSALAKSMQAAQARGLRRFGSAHVAASVRAARATNEGPLVKEARATGFTSDFYRHDELARAYERERNSRTSQVTRFITVITDFAVALFLLGLIARVPRRARWYFVAIPTVAALLTISWAIYIAASAAPRPNTRAVQFYAQGRVAFDSGSSKESVRALTKAIRLDRHFAAAYRERGDGRLQLGHWLNARHDLSIATKLDSTDFFAWNDLAVARWQLRAYKSSFAATKEAAKLNPDHPTLAFNQLEGLAVTSGATDEYYAGVSQYLHVLMTMGYGAKDDLRRAFDDLVQSAKADRNIAPQMRLVCGDLQDTAEVLGIDVTGLTCEPLRETGLELVWQPGAQPSTS